MLLELAHKMKKLEKSLGVSWIVLGIIYFYQGCSSLYNYSTPGLLWLFVIPIAITYFNLASGFLYVFWGMVLLREKASKYYFILPVVFLFSVYLISSFLVYGMSVLNYLIQHTILFLLSIITLKKLKAKEGNGRIRKSVEENKFIIVMIIIIGLVPFVLGELTNYNLFSFLH